MNLKREKRTKGEESFPDRRLRKRISKWKPNTITSTRRGGGDDVDHSLLPSRIE